MMKLTFKHTAVLLALALFFSGCMSGNDTGKQSKGADKTIMLQMRQSDSFNPLSVSHHTVRDALSLCYEPLFSINGKIELDGVLARNIEVSDDCLSAVVMLKDSVLWHDGIKFTSADVVHTINLLKENPSWEYAGCVKYIESAKTIDPLSLRINLSRPYGQIGYCLTFPIIASHNVNPDTEILGTGAYRFLKYTPATTLELVQNDKWHGGEAACGKVNVSIIRDDMAATTAFNTGLISTVTDGVFDTENSTPKQNTRTTLYPSAEYEYMAMNHRGGIFSSQTVRCAVSSAIDRTAVVKNCYGGNAMETNAPIHPAAKNVAESSILSQYNLSGASEMLFLEGYTLDEGTRLLKDKNGRKLSFTLLVNEENQNRIKTAQLLAQQLFAAGIEVNIKELPFDEYTAEIEKGNFDAYLAGTRLQNLYDYEPLLSNEGALNNYGYSGEYMQLALSALCSAPGADALSDAVFNFEEVFLREQPVCGLVFRMGALMTAENVMGKLMPEINAPYRNIWRWSLR